MPSRSHHTSAPFVAVCRVATMYDPICPDRGYLNALAGTPSSDSCGHCICPEGWGGVDCSGVRVQRAWEAWGFGECCRDGRWHGLEPGGEAKCCLRRHEHGPGMGLGQARFWQRRQMPPRVDAWGGAYRYVVALRKVAAACRGMAWCSC